MISHIKIPQNKNSQITIDLPINSSLIITGANGSGKTRLGAWIELDSKQANIVRRISAQKSLSMPDFTQTSAIEEAEYGLKYGYTDITQVQKNPSLWTISKRWGSKPYTFLLNDFDKLMTYLFTELFQKTLDHSEGKTQSNESKLYKIKTIWESVLPHRELIIEAGKVRTKIKGESNIPYNSSDMSDGERVVFYLIGQCLTAEKDSILVIDEPELHLHKSIHSKLWSILERKREDCTFVYITHDLDFAAQKSNAEKIWVKSFDGENWEWEKLPVFDELPEDLVLEVLGAREPVVFVEGKPNSFDLQLYGLFYSDSLVIPKGSCENVIQVVKGLRSSGLLEQRSIHGIIDRDRRVDAEVTNLAKHKISVLEVAEVENLFILPEIIEVVCEPLEKNFEQTFSEIKKQVIESLKNEIDVQISKRVSGDIRHKLLSFNDKSNGLGNINSSFSSTVNSIDINAIYSSVETEFKNAISSEDYLLILRLFNRKSLLTKVGTILGLNKGEYVNLILRLANGSKKEKILLALGKYLPQL